MSSIKMKESDFDYIEEKQDLPIFESDIPMPEVKPPKDMPDISDSNTSDVIEQEKS